VGPEPDAVDALEADVDGTRTVVGGGLQGRLRARDGRRVREDVRPPREPRVDEHRPVVGLDRGRVEAIRAVARLERQREHVLVRRLRVDVGVGRHP
jgi:hypothetical protein